MNEKWRFRRNFILIGLAHLLVAGLLFYFGRKDGNSGGGGGENITWVDPGAFAKKETPDQPASTPEPTPERTPPPTPEPTPIPEPTAPPPDESLLNLATPTPTPRKTPTPTPKPTATPTPKPTATPTPKPKPTPTSTPKKTPSPTPKKKPSPSPTPKKKTSPTPEDSAEADEPRKKITPSADKTPRSEGTKPSASAEDTEKKSAFIKTRDGEASGTGDPSEKTGESTGTGPGKGSGSGGGEGSGTGSGKGAGSSSGTDPAVLDAYNQVIKARCDTWEQPVSQLKADYKFTTTMTLIISKTGTLESYEVKKSSENEIVDESVKAFLGSIKRFPAPPTGKEYIVNINFQLGNE